MELKEIASELKRLDLEAYRLRRIREVKVLEEVATGRRKDYIAAELGVTPSIVTRIIADGRMRLAQ